MEKKKKKIQRFVEEEGKGNSKEIEENQVPLKSKPRPRRSRKIEN
jgi:hypothetical protein